MEQKAKKRNYKLRGKKEIEDKVISNERTPPKSLVPRAHSTPIESKVVANVESEVANGASESESEDSDDEPAFCFTQDTLEVQWDYSNTPKGKEKKKHSKIKRKPKAGTFAKNKRRQEFSPIEAIKIRKRYIKEEPKADLNKLIAGLQALAEKVKVEQGLHKNATQKNLPSEICSTNNVEHLDDDIQKSRGSKSVRKQLLAPSSPNLGLKEDVVPLTVKESFTSLFDDDADDCIVRCSQEVEQKLHEPDPVGCVTKEQLPSVSVKNSNLNENTHQNYRNNAAMGKQSVKTSEDCLDIELEKDACHLSDTQELKESCILPTIPNSDFVKNAQHGINESFTALFEDDADDCMVLCSQEIEEKLKEKHIDDNVAKILPSNNDLKSSNADKYAVSSSDKKIRTNGKKAQSDLGTSSSNNVGFDDSLDVLLQNFTEEDIDKMSQGVSVKKNVNSLTTNSNKHHFHSSENNLKSNSVVAKTSIDCRMPVTNRSVHQFTNYKHSKPFNLGSIVNKLAAVTSIKTQCKVTSVMSANANGVKLNRNFNTTVCGSMERNLNANTTLQCRTSYTGTNYLKSEIPRPNSMLKISPQKCSPEEIEKKRLEARKKLKMKKLSMMQEKSQHSHPSRWPL